jgi:hypothetical protein
MKKDLKSRTSTKNAMLSTPDKASGKRKSRPTGTSSAKKDSGGVARTEPGASSDATSVVKEDMSMSAKVMVRSLSLI